MRTSWAGTGRRDWVSERAPSSIRPSGRVAAFEKHLGASPYWQRLNRDAIAKDVRARLEDPNSFDQGGTWLCGIATFVRVWASDNPLGYVQLVIDLFEKEKANSPATRNMAARLLSRAMPC